MILEPKKIKSATVPIVSPSTCHEVVGLDVMVFVFWILSFKPDCSLSSFTFIKRLISSCSLSAIRVVSAYLRLLIFLPAILIPAYASSSLAFRMMYSAYELNKQGDNIQPSRIPFPILNQYVVPCLILTVASCPAYRFLRRQVRWSGIHTPLRIFVCCDPQSQRLCSQWSRSRCFLEFSCFFYDPMDIGNLSGISVFHNWIQVAYNFIPC